MKAKVLLRYPTAYAVGRMKTFEHEGGYALHTFYIIFFGLCSPTCYHEILRPVASV